LLKIWNVETSESVGSFDAHDDKIWSVEAWNQKVITGGRDGQMVLWKNVTDQVLHFLLELFIGFNGHHKKADGTCQH
jgi:WD40 repeat protein